MRRYFVNLLALVAAAALALAGCGGGSSSGTPAPIAPEPFTPAPIGDGTTNPEPGVFGIAIAINDFNEIIGAAAPAAGETLQPAFWMVDGVGAPTGAPALLAALVEDGFAAPFGLNNDGVIVGIAANAVGTIRAVVWADDTSAPTVLPSLAPGAPAAAYDINSSGRIVGEAENADGLLIAVRWARDSGGTVTGPFALPGVPAGWEAAAYAINSDGTIAGELIDIDGISRAALWFGDAGSYVRFDLPVDAIDSDHFVALGLNDPAAGQPLLVAGEGFDDGLTLQSRAMLWTVDEVATSSDLSANDLDSSAAAVNSAGNIVGWEGNGTRLATNWPAGAAAVSLLTIESQALDINNNNLAVGIADGGGFVKLVE